MEFLETGVPREPQRRLRAERDDPFFPHASGTESYNDGESSSSTHTVVTGTPRDVGSPETVLEDRKGSSSSKNQVNWRMIIINFTPSWFAVNMGTGIVSILLHELPYNAGWIRGISLGFFVLNIVLFVVFTLATIARYALYPDIWAAMIRHPAQSLFLGCFPMGFATIVNMTALVCADWGTGWIYAAWAMWWVDVALSLACCIGVPFIVIRRHKPALRSTTAMLLLPIVPAVVASASGAIVADVLPERSQAMSTVVVSYILFGIGESFAMLVLSMYFQRLHVYSLPPREAIVSVFLPIGPLGQGGFAVQKLGAVLLKLAPTAAPVLSTPAESLLSATDQTGHIERLGEVFYAVGIFCGLLMWGFGLIWLAFALITILAMKRFPFNMGWWGFTFPLGVFATCTSMLARALDSTILRVLTTIFTVLVLLLWILVSVRTVCMAATGKIFSAPCLQGLPKNKEGKFSNVISQAKRSENDDNSVSDREEKIGDSLA